VQWGDEWSPTRSTTFRPGPFHELHDRTIDGAFQRSKLVLDIFRVAELTGPSAARKLPCRMSWVSLRIGEESNSLETRLQTVVVAHNIAKSLESRDECRECEPTFNAGGPERSANFT
jgi:hypothetical protein